MGAFDDLIPANKSVGAFDDLIPQKPQTEATFEVQGRQFRDPFGSRLVGAQESRKEEEQKLAQFRAEAPKGTNFARDLPEIGEAPELRQLDVESMKRGFAAGLITNEAELASAIKSLTPGAEVMQDPEGKAIVKFPSGGEFAVNKPGLSGQDFIQAATRLVAFIPAGKALGAAGAIAKGAGTEAALQTAESQLGGEFSPVDVGIAGAIPAAFAGAKGVSQFFKNKSAQKQKIVNLVQQNADDVQRAGFEVAKDKLVSSAPAKEAIRQGMDDGTVALIQTASAADKKAMRNAVEILKKARQSKSFAVANRPGDAAGRVLKSRYDAVKKINRQAGAEINKAANALTGKRADVSNAYNGFLDQLQDLGVSIGRDKKGKLKGFYQDSEFAQSKSTQKILNDFIVRSEKLDMDALSAHRLKRVIDGAVEFGKKNKNPILNKGESALKSLRAGINDTLKDMSPAYRQANEKFALTRQALDDFQQAAGPSFNPLSENAEKQLVNVTRSLMSNNQKRIPAMDAINSLQEAGKKYGVKFDDDILKQAAFMDDLENLLGSSAPTSFGGQIERFAGRAIRGDKAGILVEAAEEGVKKVRGINEDALIRSIEKLLEQQL